MLTLSASYCNIMGDHAEQQFHDFMAFATPDEMMEVFEGDVARIFKPMGKDIAIVRLKNVRLSFPALFKPRAFEEGGEASYKATFLLDVDKNADDITAIEEAIEGVLDEKYPTKRPKGIKLCLRDGTEKPDTDGYGDEIKFITASSKKRVPLVDKDITVPLSEEDGKPYAGCYVNASIRLWAQDNKWGKRVNASLRAVQFVKDGTPFGEKPVDVEEEFESVDDTDEPKTKKKSRL